MAHKLITTRVCDLHGTEEATAAQTTRWGFDGHVWEIDACPGCAAQIRGVLGQLARHARAAGTSPALLPQADPTPGRTRSGHLRRDQLDAAVVISAYRDEKLSLAQVAVRFGTSRRVVEPMLAGHGIARRPPGKAPASDAPA